MLYCTRMYVCVHYHTFAKMAGVLVRDLALVTVGGATAAVFHSGYVCTRISYAVH